MDSLTNVLAWVLIIVGALISYLAKPILKKRLSESDKQAKAKFENILYITKIIGMVLVIIGAAMIFIAGGMYGRY